MMLPTRDDWDRSTPYAKGYMTYMFAERNPFIPKTNPYLPGTEAHHDFAAGEFAGLLEAQDSES